MPNQIIYLHQLPLGEAMKPEEIKQILQENRTHPLLRGLLQRMRDRSEGSHLDAAGMASEGRAGVDYQLGAAAGLRESALEFWDLAQSPDEAGDDEKSPPDA